MKAPLNGSQVGVLALGGLGEGPRLRGHRGRRPIEPLPGHGSGRTASEAAGARGAAGALESLANSHFNNICIYNIYL